MFEQNLNFEQISSLNIYEKISNNFKSLKKVQKTAKQTKNTRKPENSAQENKNKKPRRQNRKNKNRLYSKKNWASANGPRPILLRSGAERTKARPRTEHRNCQFGGSYALLQGGARIALPTGAPSWTGPVEPYFFFFLLLFFGNLNNFKFSTKFELNKFRV
jgi:hypothetical protein